MAILTLAQGWVIALGSQAVDKDQARPLMRRKTGELRRQWSLFKKGSRFFNDYVLRKSIFLKLCFIPDKRLC